MIPTQIAACIIIGFAIGIAVATYNFRETMREFGEAADSARVREEYWEREYKSFHAFYFQHLTKASPIAGLYMPTTHAYVPPPESENLARPY